MIADTANPTAIAGPITIPGGGTVTTNYVDRAGATNAQARYYRVRLIP